MSLSNLSGPAKSEGFDDGTDDTIDSNALLRKLGLPERPPYLPDGLAPPLDREILRAMARRELQGEDFDRVIGLTVRFKLWADAYTQEVIEATRELFAEEASEPEAQGLAISEEINKNLIK